MKSKSKVHSEKFPTEICVNDSKLSSDLKIPSLVPAKTKLGMVGWYIILNILS